MLPELGELLVSQQGEVRLRLSLAQSEQRGRGHYGIAEPVHATHQDPVGGGAASETGVERRPHSSIALAVAGSGNAPAGWRFDRFQRLCTQNQLAGSRRTAASNAWLMSW